MDHLYEVAATGRTAMEVTLFGCAAPPLAARGAGARANAGRERFEDGIKARNSFGRAANHHAVAALDTPHSAASSDVDIMEPFIPEKASTPHVVLEIGVAAINNGVAGFHQSGKLHNSAFGGVAGRHHDPGGAGLGQALDKILHGFGAGSAFGC